MEFSNTLHKYEVAFSFLKEDEAIAYELNDLIQDRMSTFIYSKAQEKLAGTDGEESFNKVFYEEARIVVVLYRDGWGQTSWTRIEEIAIRNRAFEKGWDFLLIIKLDDKAILPHWVPRVNIWLDYERFKTEKAVGVIEYKINSAGGNSRPETVKERANRLQRHLKAKQERVEYLSGMQAGSDAKKETQRITSLLKEHYEYIHSLKIKGGVPEMLESNTLYGFGKGGFFLLYMYTDTANYYATDSIKMVLCENLNTYKPYIKPDILKEVAYNFDRSLSGSIGWVNAENDEGFCSSEELVDSWVKDFLDGLSKRS